MSGVLRIGSTDRPTLRFRFDQVDVEALAGDTVGVALLAAGLQGFGANPVDGTARGLFCMMGSCQECVVLIDGKVEEACRVRVREGLDVRSKR